jgi:ABC-2 type transport system permease protein
MNVFRTLLRRELSAYLCSLTGYLIIGAVTLLTGIGFVVLVNTLGPDPVPVPVTELFFLSFYFWLILLLITPVITMRLFALEKATGTFETLMTTPVTDFQVVAAKFGAALLFYLIAWLPLLADLAVIQYFAHQNSTLDAGILGGMYLGIALIGGLFLSLGCSRAARSPPPSSPSCSAWACSRSLISPNKSPPRSYGPPEPSRISECWTIWTPLPGAWWTRAPWSFT